MFVFRKLESLFRSKSYHFATAAPAMRVLLPQLQGLFVARMSIITNKTSPLVRVKQGQLKGATKKLLDGSTYYSFKGIPYAQPPVGKLRFKAPLPPKSWEGIYEATEHGPVCPQYDLRNRGPIEGSEDCLFLNVYTKTIEADSKLPVMVYIHGGGYSSGSGDSDFLGPEFLVQHDVLLVTINYRLEVLGFLCLDTPEVPGNAGMRDQVAALKWVKENIVQFGGDPHNITLFGESAGASSVAQHLISPMSQGLFHRAIAQSGTCLDEWAIARGARERAFRVGKLLGKDTNDPNDLLEFLQSVPASDLLNMTLRTRTHDETIRGLPFYFVPVTEKAFDNVEPFLNEEPVDMLLSNKVNKVPLLMGYNSHEALLMWSDRLRKKDIYNKDPSYLVPRDIVSRVSDEKKTEFGKRIMEFYVGDKGICQETMAGCIDMMSDYNFVYDSHRFAHFYYTDDKPIYFYKFSCDTELNIIKKMFPNVLHMKGACHADDLFYLFYAGIVKEDYEQHERLRDIVFKLTKMWTNFAKYGNPTPDASLGARWPRYSRVGKEYLDIDLQPLPGHDAEGARVAFWNGIYSEAGLPCITRSTL